MTKLLIISFILYFLGSTSSSKPNIVILYADDLGYGDLESYGHPTSRTPNFTALASKSKVFTNFYVGSPLCSPSRAALLTGRYPVSVGVYPEVFWACALGGLPTEYKTLANVLKESGYKTSMVGKWHLGVGKDNEFLPTRHGFDNYLGIPYSHDMCPCPVCFPGDTPCNDPEESCDFDTIGCPLYSDETIIEQPVDLLKITDQYTEKAIEIIKEANEDEPFFLYMAFQHTHQPQFAGEKFYNKFERGPFGDAIAELDWSVGQILDTLESENLLENTLVIFSSDNGPSLNQHTNGGCAGPFRCGKGTTYEGGMRMPGFFRYDGKIKPGYTHELASTLDIMPTIMSLVGYEGNVTHHGYDLSNLLFEDGTSPRTVLAYYGAEPEEDEGPYAVRHNQYKGHFFTKGHFLSDPDNLDEGCRPGPIVKHDPPVIYDLFRDPAERWPLEEGSDEYQAALEGVLEARRQIVEQIGQWPPSEVNKGKDNSACSCCTEVDCEPFPTCCDCKSSKQMFFRMINW